MPEKASYFYETLEELDQIAAKAQDKGSFVEGHQPDTMIETFHKEMSNDFSTVGAIRDLHLAMKKPVI